MKRRQTQIAGTEGRARDSVQIKNSNTWEAPRSIYDIPLYIPLTFDATN